jgi:rubrerythrin
MTKKDKLIVSVKRIGRKTYVIDNRKWVCCRCEGTGMIQLMSNQGLTPSNCPRCNIRSTNNG